MRVKNKLMMALFVIVLLCCVCICAGCTIGGDLPKEEVKEDTEYTFEFPNKDQLGMPLYESNVDPCSIKSEMEKGPEGLDYIGVEYMTSDDFDTVVSWYEMEFGEPAQTSTLPDGNKEAVWAGMDGDFAKSTRVTQTSEGTAISINRERV